MRFIFILLNFILFCDIAFGDVISVINDAVKIKNMLESFSSKNGTNENKNETNEKRNISSAKMPHHSLHERKRMHNYPVRSVLYSDKNAKGNSWRQSPVAGETFFYPEKLNDNTRRLGNQGTLIKRKTLFTDKSKRLMSLNPYGQEIAYLVREDNKDVVYTASVDKTTTPSAVFSANTSIDYIKFVGKNWMAIIVRDDHNYATLILLNLTNGNFYNINLINNARTIEIKTAKMVDDIAVKCFDGRKYFTFFIRIPSLKVEKIKEDTIPVWMIFDEYLVPIIFCNNFNGIEADVFICGKNGSTRNAKFIERINLENERCIAINGDYYYKLSKIENKIQFVIWNLRTGNKDFITLNARNMKGNIDEFIESSHLSDYTVNLDVNGLPMFITRNVGYRTNISLSDRANASINTLNNRFYNSSWYRVDETIDGNTWLIKVCNPRQPSSYYLFDRKKSNCVEVEPLDSNFLSDSLTPVKCVQIPVNNTIKYDIDGVFSSRGGIADKFVYGYFARVSAHDKAPLIIFIEADGKHRFSWEFDPMVQMLTNRGYNVLCVNCCIKHVNDGPVVRGLKIQKMSSSIMDVVKWCIEKKIAKPGNISLVGKRANGIYCTDAFLRNQGIFSICLAISTDFPKNADPILNEDILGKIDSPLVVINSKRNSEKYMSYFSNLLRNFEINQPNYKYDFNDHASEGSSGSVPLLLFMVYDSNPNDSDAAAILERIFSSIYNFVEEDMGDKILMKFPVLFNGTKLLNSDRRY